MKFITHKLSYYIINGITLYRVIAAPFLLLFLYLGEHEIFKWLLLLSFFTDLIDGTLARKFAVTSVLGTRLDSIGDDLTVMVAAIGLFVLHPAFLKDQISILMLLFVLLLIQSGYAFYKYGKTTNFHTYLAKAAALAQGAFLLLTFFMEQQIPVLFYAAALITFLQLIEEIMMVWMLPVWDVNQKGIYWVIKKKKGYKV
ncbi:MAG TPA: CDP-alcohol phosphatidyltransferase family protein, partial [Ferruginibacter sp.]|nr:CDP-alcohol phosphatidyltransferase family protein [Ferruginibacter sp.]